MRVGKAEGLIAVFRRKEVKMLWIKKWGWCSNLLKLTREIYARGQEDEGLSPTLNMSNFYVSLLCHLAQL